MSIARSPVTTAHLTAAITYLNQAANIHGSNLGLLPSYGLTATADPSIRLLHNVAFTYDNAVATIAWVAMGDRPRAQRILDSLLYARQRDRAYRDGRLRNAYRVQPFLSADRRVLLPGWWDATQRRWSEDELFVSTHTGNIAWVILALLAYYQTFGGETYLTAAQQLGDWIETHCRDRRGAGGYTAGYSGWEPQPQPLRYKSTEHNLDVYAAFSQLYKITNDPVWRQRAIAARNFVHAMAAPASGHVWLGTQVDGVQINRQPIVLDTQSWTVLAFTNHRDPFTPFPLARLLTYAERHLSVQTPNRHGFDFNSDRDGIWYEGTAHMALAYKVTGQTDQAEQLLKGLRSAQILQGEWTGAIPASDRPNLTTGLNLPHGQPWLYFPLPHLGATAWYILAELEINPFGVVKSVKP